MDWEGTYYLGKTNKKLGRNCNPGKELMAGFPKFLGTLYKMARAGVPLINVLSAKNLLPRINRQVELTKKTL